MIKFILEKKILLGLMTVLVVILGVYSISKLDVEIMPEIEFDGAFVVVDAGEMAAIEVERNITEPLEQQILEMDGVESVQSSTTIGNATFQIFIEEGRGEEVAKEIQSEVSALTPSLYGVEDVITMQMVMGSDYEFFMDISGGDIDKMTAFAEKILEPRLEDLPEVKDIDLMGIQEYEMVIVLDRDKMVANGLDISQVISLVQMANSDTTLGEFSSSEGNSVLRLETSLSSVDQVKNIEIPTENRIKRLKDLASISIEPLETSSYVWKDGSKDFIFVQAARNADVTQIQMAHAIREEIEKIREEGLIEEFTLNEVVSQADYVEESINGITENILIGGIIAILVLIAYLRNIRATLIILISIPTSLLLTFTIMGLLGYSINMLTLIALGLGVAMMIDSSIVVLESIYKKKEQGYKAVDAVVNGTKEVTSALIASLLTTIAVFVPIGLMSGEIGIFLVIIAVVVSITLIISLLVAFTLIPALSENFLKLRNKRRFKEGRILTVYGNFISWIVDKKRNSLMMVALFLAMFVGSIFLLFKVPMTVMPDIYNRYTEMIVELETGTSESEKENTIRRLTEAVTDVKDVESSFVVDNGPYLFLLINMTKGDEITRDQKEVNEELLRSLRELVDDYPISSVNSALSFSGGQPVQIQIRGEDFEVLKSLAQDVSKELDSISGIVGITNSMEQTSEQNLLELDRKAMEDAHVSEMQLRSFIQQLFLNMPIGEIMVNDQSMPLAVKWKDELSSDMDLLAAKIPTIAGEKQLSEFISIKTVETPNEIARLDGERVITVSADIENTDLGTVNRNVQQFLNEFSAPKGYTVSTGGDLEAQQEFFFEMLMILGIAIFLVYLVMAVQFNNLAHPIIIMSVIPMAFVGVVLGLFATQRELNIMSAMGIVMLVGIVLNNAILLIDRVKQLRRIGYPVNKAIVQAGKDRIRPIFMTTFTTVGGMLPLALASGTTGSYQAPMATAVITGLLFATLITLVLIPAVYRIFNAVGNGFAKLFKKQEQPLIQEERKRIELAK